MQQELKANENKGHFSEWKPDFATVRQELFHHVNKLAKAIACGDKERVSEHAADSANVLMKIEEVFGIGDQCDTSPMRFAIGIKDWTPFIDLKT